MNQKRSKTGVSVALSGATNKPATQGNTKEPQSSRSTPMRAQQASLEATTLSPRKRHLRCEEGDWQSWWWCGDVCCRRRRVNQGRHNFPFIAFSSVPYFSTSHFTLYTSFHHRTTWGTGWETGIRVPFGGGNENRGIGPCVCTMLVVLFVALVATA